MSSFTNPLVVSPLSDGKKWCLVVPFEYHVGELGSGEVIEVAKFFITDFASIPRLFWSILPPWGRYGKATIIHDYCYKTRQYDRLRCDEIFLEAMEVLGVKPWKRRVIYRAVRLFGGFAYYMKS